MSETVTNIGVLAEIKPNEGETLEQLVERLLKENNVTSLHYYQNIFECFRDELYEKYFLNEDTIYQIKDRKTYSDDIFEAHKNEDGTINYVLQYYNGGCSFGEALETALKKIKNND